MGIRGFEIVRNGRLKTGGYYKIPERGTKHSAGYDFYLPYDVTVNPHEMSETIWTGIKAYMQPHEALLIDVRSSIGHKGLRLGNTVGVIDSDYYSNPNSDGDIGVRLVNDTNKPIHLKRGERIVQGIFVPYLIADDDNCTTQRVGGYGSTGA